MKQLDAVSQSIVTGTTSKPAARSAASTAASISGSLRVAMRPIVPAGVTSASNPGSSSSMPRRVSSTRRPSGPIVSNDGASGQTPSSGMRPNVVFSPVTPQQAAGIRTDPPVSEPSATSASSVATATAEPLDDPPGTSAASSGFTGVPNHGF